MPEHGLSMEALESRLAKHKGELERAQEEYKTADAKEKAELRAEIEELKGHIAAERQAKEEKEKAEGTGGTLVLPPEQVPQGQQHGDRPGDKPTEQVERTNHGDKPRGLKRWW